MPKKFFKSPLELVNQWPEVFEDMYIGSMPVDYLQFLRLSFQNGRIWEIDIQEQLLESNNDVVAQKLVDIFTEYKDEISRIDFAVDVIKLKKDIANQTKDLL